MPWCSIRLHQVLLFLKRYFVVTIFYIMVIRVSLHLVCSHFQVSCSRISPTDDQLLYFEKTYLIALFCTISVEYMCPAGRGSMLFMNTQSAVYLRYYKLVLWCLHWRCRSCWRNPRERFALLSEEWRGLCCLWRQVKRITHESFYLSILRDIFRIIDNHRLLMVEEGALA